MRAGHNITFLSDWGLQPNIDALDDWGFSVSNPELVFCSFDDNIVSVDQTGYLEIWGMGTTTVRVCSGTYATFYISVTVGW